MPNKKRSDFVLTLFNRFACCLYLKLMLVLENQSITVCWLNIVLQCLLKCKWLILQICRIWRTFLGKNSFIWKRPFWKSLCFSCKIFIPGLSINRREDVTCSWNILNIGKVLFGQISLGFKFGKDLTSGYWDIPILLL